jgi:hypothetical protein
MAAADDMHNLGVGTLLLEHLISLATVLVPVVGTRRAARG